MNQTRTNYQDDGNRYPISYYLKRWYLYAFALAMLFAGAYYYLEHLVIPEYRVGATVLVKEKDRESISSSMEALAELNIFQPVSKIENEIEILRSDSLMYKALETLNQDVRYFDGRQEVYFKSLPFRVVPESDMEFGMDELVTIHANPGESLTLHEGEEDQAVANVYQFGEQIVRPYGVFRVVRDTNMLITDSLIISFGFTDLDEQRQEYQDKLGVGQVNIKSNVISMGVVDALPKRGVDLLNLILEGYEVAAIEEKNKLAVNTLELIDERLGILTSELSSVERNVEAYKRENELTDVQSDADIYLERANDYSRQLGDYQLRMEVLNSIERYLKQNQDNFSAVPSSLNIQDATLNVLIARYNQLQLERQEILNNSTASNPLVINLNRQLEVVRQNILENIVNVKESLQLIQANLEENSRKFERQIRKVPSIERDLLEIKRQQSIKNSIYLYLLQKREETALSMAVGMSNLRVISPPRAGKVPVNNRRSLVYFVALLAGLFIPTAALTVRRMFFTRIEKVEQISAMTNIPVLGTIGRGKGRNDALVTANRTDSNAELFRLMVYKLEFSYTPEDKVFMVTSSKSGEGKTFVADNLGASLALSGKRTVVVNLDLRNPGQMNAQPPPGTVGISEYLAKEQDLDLSQMLFPSKQVDKLSYLWSGKVPEIPALLMRRDGLSVLIDALRKTFDMVIIDTAPIGMVSDAFALAKMVDATLYVVRGNTTEKSDIAIIQDLHNKEFLPKPTIILNDFVGRAATYGYFQN